MTGPNLLRVFTWAARTPVRVVVKKGDGAIVAGAVATVGVTFVTVRHKDGKDERIAYADVVEVRRRDGRMLWPSTEMPR